MELGLFKSYLCPLILKSVTILLGIFPHRILNGRNLINIIISLELLLFGIALFNAHISYVFDDMSGILISFIILPLAGCESAIALSILINYYPRRGTLVI